MASQFIWIVFIAIGPIFFGVHALWDQNEFPLVKLKRFGDQQLSRSTRLAMLRVGWNCGLCSSVWVSLAINGWLTSDVINKPILWVTNSLGSAAIGWVLARIASTMGWFDETTGSPNPDLSNKTLDQINDYIAEQKSRQLTLAESDQTHFTIKYHQQIDEWRMFAEDQITEIEEQTAFLAEKTETNNPDA